MIRLPKIKRHINETEGLCKCRPICKNRRRMWKGLIQNTSAELLLERKPLPECVRRLPKKVFQNSPCPLFGRRRRVAVEKKGPDLLATKVVRICEAPVDDTVDTTYLQYAKIAKQIGAWDAVRASCAFCECGSCCPCGATEYIIREEEKAALRAEMKRFDSRVKISSGSLLQSYLLLFKFIHDINQL